MAEIAWWSGETFEDSAYIDAINEAHNLRRETKEMSLSKGLSQPQWEFAGPINVGGRVVDLEFDPSTSPSEFNVQDVYDNTLSYNVADKLADKFYYVNIPVRLEYRISPRVSVAAGVKAAVLLSAPARYNLNDQRLYGSSLGGLFAPSSKSFLYDYGIVKKIDIAPEAALSWKAARRVWLDAGYQYGTIPYINKSNVAERGDYHRSVTLGVRYAIL